MGLATLGIGVRLALIAIGVGDDRFLFADSWSYLDVARALPSGLWDPGDEVGSTMLARTPIYPLVLAIARGHEHLVLAMVVQAIIGGGVNVALAHRLTSHLSTPRAALLAGGAMALDPVSIGSSLTVATEVLAATFVLLVLLLTWSLMERAGTGIAKPVALGAAGGALALTRPNLLPLIVVAAAAIVVARGDREGWRRAGLVLAVALVFVGGWMGRNQAIAGRPVLSTVTGQNLVTFGLAASLAEDGSVPFGPADQEAFDADLARRAREVGITDPVDGDASSVVTDHRWTGEGLDLLRRHPSGVAFVAGRGIVLLAVAPANGAVERHLPLGAEEGRDGGSTVGRVLATAWLLGLGVGSILGLATLRARRHRHALVLLVGIGTIQVVASMGPWMDARFRVALLPVVATLAAIGVDAQLAAREHRRDQRPLVD